MPPAVFQAYAEADVPADVVAPPAQKGDQQELEARHERRGKTTSAATSDHPAT